jgi:hypothetical protein
LKVNRVLKGYQSKLDMCYGENKEMLKFVHIVECQKFIETRLRSEVFSCLNSAGKPLSQLFSDDACLANTEEEIVMFLACLEVYGSMPNPENTYSNKEYFITDYMTQCRFPILDQLKELIKRLKKVSKGANSIF